MNVNEVEQCNVLNSIDCLSDEILLKSGVDFKYWFQTFLDEFKVLNDFDFIKLFSSNSTWVFCLSILFFLYAHRIVRSATVFYSGGVCLGIFSSFIIIALILQKFLPKHALVFPLNLGGWPISFYIYYKIWQNFGLILRNYFPYFITYIAIMVLISFAICYRFGPPSNLRTINIIKWSLQILACIGIYFSCPIRLLSIITILSLITWPFWFKLANYVCKFSSNLFHLLRIKIFGPTPRKLLTQKECADEVRAYTRMQLKQLRMFCRNSPSKKSWEIISRLKDPKRMASFVNGHSDHITKEEYSMHKSVFCDDEDDENTIDDDSYSNIEKSLTSDNRSHKKLNKKTFTNNSSNDFFTDDDDD